jgi:hypothetical protein
MMATGHAEHETEPGRLGATGLHTWPGEDILNLEPSGQGAIPYRRYGLIKVEPASGTPRACVSRPGEMPGPTV